MNPAQPLIDLKKEKDYLICIDSDGCAFDAMEIKHKECFCPNFIKHWNLQAVSKYAREVWEFINLYSESRGTNRFHAVMNALNLLEERPEVIRRGYKKPDLSPLVNFVQTETKLGNPALERAVANNPDPVLQQALNWSNGVNQFVADIVKNVPPFPYVRETIEKATKSADLIVVAGTPGEALVREWNEHGLAEYMKVIASQEMGTKKEHIALAMKNRYDADKVLKIGDALGDLEAAKANNVHFYPINPGHEEESWKQLFEVDLDKFINGEFTREYEDQLAETFKSYLPVTPPWKK
ncbi:MAG: HAD hydrolase-like protein [Clostridiales bacterium]|nr:HAD hydrolase-like protein [Clostridiales bacterium]